MRQISQEDLAVAAALELMLEIAGQEPDDPGELGRENRRAIAVIATAWDLEGYALNFLADAYTGHRHTMQERVYQSLRHRPRSGLRQEARSLIRTIRFLFRAGALTAQTMSECRRQIWLGTQERRIA